MTAALPETAGTADVMMAECSREFEGANSSACGDPAKRLIFRRLVPLYGSYRQAAGGTAKAQILAAMTQRM